MPKLTQVHKGKESKWIEGGCPEGWSLDDPNAPKSEKPAVKEKPSTKEKSPE